MTLPASGTITLDQFRLEMGNTGSIDLSWISDNTKAGQRPSPNSMAGYYSKAWYQSNAEGNCNNGNCTNNCNCGNVQCVNCFISDAVNCANCDTRAWLQNNCNCACTYNCNSSTTATYNCDCDCDCNCLQETACFPAGVPVLLFDGSWKPVEQLVFTDILMGADGKPAYMKQLHSPVLGGRRLLSFEEDQTMVWSHEHLFWARSGERQWWWVDSHDSWIREVDLGVVAGLKDNYSHLTGRSVEFASLSGFVRRTPVDVTDKLSDGADTRLYLPMTVTGVPIVVAGYVVGSGVNEFVYDYSKFDWDLCVDAVVKKVKVEDAV